MTSERLRQVEELFSQVVELDPAQRTAVLDARCGDDPALKDEVISLLLHSDPPERFLSDPALGAEFGLGRGLGANDDLVGTIIGPYRVLRRLASGGMGTVCLAARADGQFEQQVAIKFVKRGMDSEEILRRFAQERRTLATLIHPHIARLLDGGVAPDGRPYLVMEYVKGVPITQYCEEQHLSTTRRLRLFCAVCDAVHFAHQKLVVHRDLKPGNLLVDETGAPKLLDFGVSKVIVGAGSAELTIAAERRFTPEYASPEQVAGQPLSTATDIYSLGVVLYELLTGCRPFAFTARTVAEIERVVCEQQPLPPSAMVEQTKGRSTGAVKPAGTDAAGSSSLVHDESPQRLRRRLSGDLDTIVLKAMHKDPSRRYVSVDQFAADIERHLSGLPVLARPDTLQYRLRKYARRHAVGLALAAVAAAALVIGSGVAVWQGRVARVQRDAAYLSRDQAEATSEFLQRMLGAIDPANEGPEAKVRTVLDEAALRVGGELPGQPLIQASVRSMIGRTYLALGLLPQADEQVRAAYDIRSRLLEPGHHDIAESELDIANVFYAQGEFVQAEKLLNDSLAIHRRLRGEENLDTARVWNDLGAVRKAAGNFAEAETAYRRALDIREKLSGRESLDVAESLNNLAGLLRAKGETSQAERAIRESLEIRRRLLRPDHPLVLQSMANLAVMTAAGGNLAGAETLLRETVELDRKVYGSQHPALAVDLSGLARVLSMQQKWAEAEPYAREALEIRRQRLPPGDERLLRTQVTLAECLVHQGRDSEAEPLLADAIDRARPNIRPGDEFWITAVESLEAIYRHSGDAPKEAKTRTLRAELCQGR